MTTLGYFCLSFAGGDGHDKQGNYGLIFLTQGLIAGVGMACYFMHSSYLSIQVSGIPGSPKEFGKAHEFSPSHDSDT